jgi:hypothetical protein
MSRAATPIARWLPPTGLQVAELGKGSCGREMLRPGVGGRHG